MKGGVIGEINIQFLDEKRDLCIGALVFMKDTEAFKKVERGHARGGMVLVSRGNPT